MKNKSSNKYRFPENIFYFPISANKILVILFCLFLSLFVSSCDEDVSNSGYIIKNGIEPPLFQSISPEANRYITARLLVSSEKFGNDDSIVTKSLASFYSFDYLYVNAGRVELNGDSLEMGTAADILGLSGKFLDIYKYGDAYKKILPEIQPHFEYIWNVSGSKFFEGMQLSVTSPDTAVTITEPKHNATVSKTQNLIIKWDSERNLGEFVRISIISSKKNVYFFVEDDGEYVLDGNSFALFENGLLKFEILGGNHLLKQLESGYWAMAAVYFRHQIDLNLTD